jgi:predicted ABC-type ATPase
MISLANLDRRPLVVCIAGPNGAGKTTFYEAHLRPTGLPFFNADQLARELAIDAYAAAGLADALRRKCIARRDSFLFETVFSDPVADKVDFLAAAAESGYTVVLCFIGLSRAALSEERVAIRVAQGGHDVPTAKLRARFPRTLRNLQAAIERLPYVFVYDNDDLSAPFRAIAAFEQGRLVEEHRPWPRWLSRMTRPHRR